MSTPFFTMLVELSAKGEPFAVATVVSVEGATSAKPGAKAIIDTTGNTVLGWVGGGCAESAVREEALASLQDGQTRRYAQRSLSRHCLFVLMSDGLDTGEPEVLAAELGKIKPQVKKLIWLNPLLGWQHYQPLARGMQAALPHTDVFAPAHTLESLLQLEHHFRVW